MKKNIFFGLIWTFFLAIFSIFIFPGYNVEKEDQQFYTPPILQKIDPQIYNDDFFMKNAQTQATIFDELVAFFCHQKSDIYWVYFFLSIFSRFLFFSGIFLFAYKLSDEKIFAFLSPAVFIFFARKFICNGLPPDSFLFHFALEVHPRSFAVSILVFALSFLFFQKFFWTFFIASLAILIHPITALPVIGFLSLFFLGSEIIAWPNNFKIKNWKIHWKNFFYFLLPLSFLLIIFLILFLEKKSGNSGLDIFARVDDKWFEFFKIRTGYIFLRPFLFSFDNLKNIFLPLIIFYLISVFSQKINTVFKKFISTLFFVSIFYLLLGFLGFEIFRFAIFTQFQFSRFLIFLRIFLFITTFFALFAEIFLNKKREISEKIIFSLALWGIIFKLEFFLPFFLAAAGILSNKFNSKKQKNIFNYLFFLFFFLGILLFKNTPTVKLFWELFSNFFRNIFVDFKISLGIFLAVFKRIFLPLAIFLGIIFYYQFSNFKKYFESSFLATFLEMPFFSVDTKVKSKKYFKFYFLIIFLGIFVFSINAKIKNIENFIEKTDITILRNDDIGKLLRFVKENIPNDKLILSQTSRKYIRNRLFKNIFVAHIDGAQGTFSRQYALEYLYKMELLENPQKFRRILQKKYQVDFFIGTRKKNKHNLNQFGPTIFSAGEYFVQKNPWNKSEINEKNDNTE